LIAAAISTIAINGLDWSITLPVILGG